MTRMDEALAEAAAAAVACEAATGLPATLQLAQWALESAWGLRSPGNNCFGIKALEGHATQQLDTIEYQQGRPQMQVCAFAAFESLQDCFLAHAQLITAGERYRAVWGEYLSHRDALTLAKALGPIYATDPAYGVKLVALMTGTRIPDAVEAAERLRGTNAQRGA